MKTFSHSLTSRIAFCALFGLGILSFKTGVKSASANPTTRGAGPHDLPPRQGDGAPGLTPFCDTAASVICYQDTARLPAAGTSEYPLANWLWFGAAGDSIEISTNPPASIVTSIGEDRDSLNNTARYFRRRLARNGVIEVFVVLEQGYGDTVPYALSIRRNGFHSSDALRPTGEAAMLTVKSRHKGDSFSLVPISLTPSVRDRYEWRIYPHAYKVALVSDSLYELCRFPCSRPDTIKLTPFANVVKRF